MGIRTSLGLLTVLHLASAGCTHQVRPLRDGADALLVCPAGTVAWRGDITGWESAAVEMERGTPVVRLHGLVPGPHRFQCVLGDGAGTPPAGTDWIEDDGFGGRNGVLAVEGDRGAAATLDQQRDL